jgi:hypothetical protein
LMSLMELQGLGITLLHGFTMFCFPRSV